MLKWFRQGPSPHQTALAMIGARAGDRLLVVGSGDAALAAEIARVTGLNGSTVVIDRADGASARVDQAAARAGALIEFEDAPPTMMPFDSESFDIVVITRTDRLPDGQVDAIVAESLRVLKPAGRAIVLAPARRGGVLGAATPAPASPLPALERAGAVAARHLADAEGTAYFEARKGRPRS